MQNAIGRSVDLPACRPAGLPACVPGVMLQCSKPGGWWLVAGGWWLVACVPKSRGEGGPSARRVGHGTLHEQFFIF